MQHALTRSLINRWRSVAALSSCRQLHGIFAALRSCVSGLSLQLEDVSLTNISFGPEYTAAVESKQVAQQQAERAKYQVDRAKQDKKSVIVKAQGEAQSAEMINNAMMDNPGYLELRRIEKAREVAKAVSHSANKVYLDSDVLMFNMGSEVLEHMRK